MGSLKPKLGGAENRKRAGAADGGLYLYPGATALAHQQTRRGRGPRGARDERRTRLAVAVLLFAFVDRSVSSHWSER